MTGNLSQAPPNMLSMKPFSNHATGSRVKSLRNIIMKRWECLVCGFIYDEAKGWPDDGIPPGTRWEDVPEDWECPDCGVSKSDFEMIELEG